MIIFNKVPVGSIIKCIDRYFIKFQQAVPGMKPHCQGSNCIALDNLHRITFDWCGEVELVARPEEIDDLDFELIDKFRYIKQKCGEKVRDNGVKGDLIINSGENDQWYSGEPENSGAYLLTVRDLHEHDSTVIAIKRGSKWIGVSDYSVTKIIAYKRVDVNPLLEPYDDDTVFFNILEPGDVFEYEGKQYIRICKQPTENFILENYFNSYCIDNSTLRYFCKNDRVLKSHI